ncbi:MAG: hypothetical protein IPM13_09115 [Phycisphaerales bacterium]|nr:hypothetical protein [Phycisphaerales bacterium]
MLALTSEGSAYIQTPLNDARLPNYQSWRQDPNGPGLDRRGNWLWHATRVGDPNLPAAETTRTLPTGGPAGTGGKANEYGRVQLVAAGQPIDHELVYDAAGNLVRVDVVGDLNCDGEVTFDDLDTFMLALTDPNGYAQRIRIAACCWGTWTATGTWTSTTSTTGWRSSACRRSPRTGTSMTTRTDSRACVVPMACSSCGSGTMRSAGGS